MSSSLPACCHSVPSRVLSVTNLCENSGLDFFVLRTFFGRFFNLEMAASFSEIEEECCRYSSGHGHRIGIGQGWVRIIGNHESTEMFSKRENLDGENSMWCILHYCPLHPLPSHHNYTTFVQDHFSTYKDVQVSKCRRGRKNRNLDGIYSLR